MTNNTKSLDERIVEYQEQVFRKPTQDYDSLSGCGNEGDLFWGGYALGEYDTHTDNKPLIYALIADRARLLAEVESLKTKYYCKHCARSWNYYTDELPNFHAYGDKPCPGPVILLGKSNKGE